jgi:hypothetical protein
MWVVAVWLFIDSTQVHPHRPYKEKEAALCFAIADEVYGMSSSASVIRKVANHEAVKKFLT